jgi:hypothetical protein
LDVKLLCYFDALFNKSSKGRLENVIGKGGKNMPEAIIILLKLID